jgi:hypothetical protein
MPSNSTTPTLETGAIETIPGVRLEALPSIWSLLTPSEQQQFVKDSPISEAALSPLAWARRWTKTKDEQDPANPYCRDLEQSPSSQSYHQRRARLVL